MIMTLYWFASKDFERVFKYEREDLLGTQGLTKVKALGIIAFHKTWYLLITLIIPMLIVEVPWWQMILGFIMMHAITGLSLALIFQPAHVICETNFYEKSEEGTVENNWAIHQMHTTSNFANDARIFSWFVGGLNNHV
jgi:linoleoyl-CoA desaturase